jgi:hypothetical protein
MTPVRNGKTKDFMFTLTREEVGRISQSVTSSKVKYSKRVTAFTEQGVAMLSPGLNRERAPTITWPSVFCPLCVCLQPRTSNAPQVLRPLLLCVS